MGILKAVGDSISGSLGEQWKDIYSVDAFGELEVLKPAWLKSSDNGRGSNFNGSSYVISNGSVIYIPENTAMFIFSESGIESVVTEPGKFIYNNGQESIFNNGGIESLINQVADRIGYGGITPDHKRIVFLNLREIRNIKFGTRGAMLYNDVHYGIDMGIYAYGTLAVKVTDPVKFITKFVPANASEYSFGNPNVRNQIISEFLQSFMVALNRLSDKYRVSKIPSHALEVVESIEADARNAGSWEERYGFKLVNIAIDNIELSEESQALINKYADKKISVSAYEDVSQSASNIAAQQKVASGIDKHGFGDGAGMFMAMNMAPQMNPINNQGMSLDEQVDALKKLKELLDIGVLTQEEFDKKKKEIMGL